MNTSKIQAHKPSGVAKFQFISADEHLCFPRISKKYLSIGAGYEKNLLYSFPDFEVVREIDEPVKERNRLASIGILYDYEDAPFTHYHIREKWFAAIGSPARHEIFWHVPTKFEIVYTSNEQVLLISQGESPEEFKLSSVHPLTGKEMRYVSIPRLLTEHEPGSDKDFRQLVVRGWGDVIQVRMKGRLQFRDAKTLALKGEFYWDDWAECMKLHPEAFPKEVDYGWGRPESFSNERMYLGPEYPSENRNMLYCVDYRSNELLWSRSVDYEAEAEARGEDRIGGYGTNWQNGHLFEAAGRLIHRPGGIDMIATNCFKVMDPATGEMLADVLLPKGFSRISWTLPVGNLLLVGGGSRMSAYNLETLEYEWHYAEKQYRKEYPFNSLPSISGQYLVCIGKTGIVLYEMFGDS